MISKELWDACQRVWKRDCNAKDAWSLWASVSDIEGIGIVNLLSRFLCDAITDRRRPIPIRELRDYQELARLTLVSPWTELVVLSPDGKSMELNGDITKEDAQLLLNSYAENTSICSDP